MAKDKERSVNPAQAQRKAEKAKALKKSRNEQQVKRNEKLARRNPDRIQRQIDDLKALESSGEIKAREKAILADLERDLKAVRKAKESLGDHQRGPPPPSAATTGSGSRQAHARSGFQDSERTAVLGKRGHDGQRRQHHDRSYSSGSETDESVRNIPMPRDTPPPTPRAYHQRRPYRANDDVNGFQQHQQQQEQGGSGPHGLPPRPAGAGTAVYESKTTYSSAPQLRDLKQEAISRFVPDIVRRKNDAVRGQGGLLEPEELDRLEKEGYYNRNATEKPATSNTADAEISSEHHNNNNNNNDDNERHGGNVDIDQDQHDILRRAEARRLQAEEARFQEELAQDMAIDDIADDIKADNKNAEINAATNERAPEDQVVDDGKDDGEHDEDEDEDEEEDYLPPLMSGKGMFNNLPPPSRTQTQTSTTSFPSDGTTIAAGLFSKLPKPKNENEDHSVSRQVQMEEVQDEDG